MRCIRGLVILAGAVTVLAPAALRLPAGQAAGQTQVAVSGYITARALRDTIAAQFRWPVTVPSLGSSFELA